MGVRRGHGAGQNARQHQSRQQCWKNAEAGQEGGDLDDDSLGMVIEKTGERGIINLDFVTRIRQYPRKKNGKKEDIVLD